MRAITLSIRNHYLDLIALARCSTDCFERSSIFGLVMLSSLLSCIALIGNLTVGYEFGFMTINAMSVYIPAFLLQWMTVCGDSALLMGLLLVFAPKHARLHWCVLLAAIIGGVMINLLKDYFAIPRPPAVLAEGSFFLTGEGYKTRSFPSGHSFTAFLMATICFLYCKKTLYRWSFIVLASLTALSRVWIGVHWPSDVLIGGAMGIGVGLICVWLANKWPIGLNVVVHIFSLSIIFLASQIVFFGGNDYPYALPLMYAVAILAVIQVIRHYLWPKRSH